MPVLQSPDQSDGLLLEFFQYVNVFTVLWRHLFIPKLTCAGIMLIFSIIQVLAYILPTKA